MKAEYLNPFIEASINIIKQTTGLYPRLGEIFIRSEPYTQEDLIVLIGLTGQISGSAVITFKKEVACKIASAMMMGIPVNELDEIAKSAIGELCNMVLGNTATIFSTKEINIDITPPTVFTGQNMEMSIHRGVVVCIPLVFDNEMQMHIDISYLDKT